MKHLNKLALLALLSAQYSYAQEQLPQFDAHTLSENQQKNQQRQIQLGEVKTWHSGTINALDHLSSSGSKVLGWDNSQQYIALFSTESATPTLLTEINLSSLGNEYNSINQIELINKGTKMLIWGDIRIYNENNHYQTEARLSLFSFNDTFNLIEDHSLKLNNNYSSMQMLNSHIFLSGYNNTLFYIDDNKLIESATINNNHIPYNISSTCIDKSNQYVFMAGSSNSWDNRPSVSIFKMDVTNHQLNHKANYIEDGYYNVICESSDNVIIQSSRTITNLEYNVTDNTLIEKWQLDTYNDLGDSYSIDDASIYNNTLFFNERDYNPESNIASFTIDDTGLALIEKTNIYSNNYGSPAYLENILFNNGQLMGLATDLDTIFVSTINDNATINSTLMLKDGEQNSPNIPNVQSTLLSADGENLYLLDRTENKLHRLIKDDNQAFILADSVNLANLSGDDYLYNSQIMLTDDNQIIILSESFYMVFSVNEQNTLSFIHKKNHTITDNEYFYLATSDARFNKENNILSASDNNSTLYFFKLNNQSSFEPINSIENEDSSFYYRDIYSFGNDFYIMDDTSLNIYSYDTSLNAVTKTSKMAVPYGTRDILLSENNVYLYNDNSRTMQAYAKQDNGELTLLSLSSVKQNDSNFTLMSPYLATSLNDYTNSINFYHINPKTGIWSSSEQALPLPSKNNLDFIPSNNHFLKHINLLQDNYAIKEVYQLPVKRAPLIRSQKDKYTFLTNSNITLDLSSLFIEEDTDDTLTFSVEGLPQELSLNEHHHIVGVVTQATSGFLTITATDKDELTTDLTLEYDIKASAFDADSSTVVTVNPNQAISLDLVTHFFGEDTTLITNTMTFTLLASDTISNDSTTGNTLALTENGLLTGTLVDAGLHSVMIAVTLDEGIQNVLTLDMQVNVAPTVLENSGFAFNSSATISIDLNTVFSDPENNALTFEVSSLPSGLTLLDTGIISGSVNQTGHYSFTVKATDDMALSTDTSINLDINSDDDSGGTLGLISLLLLSLFGYSRKKAILR